MNDVLHTAVERNYYFSSVPRFVNIFLAIFVGLINDWLITKRIISLTNLRKSFTAICKIDKFGTMEILTIGWLWILFSFIDHLGVSDCCLLCRLRWDIGGDSFFNIEFGIWSQCSRFRCECIGLGPKLSGFPQFTRPHSNKWSCYPCTIHHRRLDYQCKFISFAFMSDWRSVFGLTFGLYTATTIIYSVWGSGKVQPWNSAQKCAQDSSSSTSDLSVSLFNPWRVTHSYIWTNYSVHLLTLIVEDSLL